MLYLILGSNKEKIDKEITKISGKSLVEKTDAFNFDADSIRGKVGGFSLFGNTETSVNVLNNISESEENFEILKGLLSGLSEASDIFIVAENDLVKEEIKFFEKAGAKIIEISEVKKDPTSPKSNWASRDKDGYNPFAIADAVGKRSAKEAWIEYIKSRENNNEPEEIHGRVVGKVRDILIAETVAAEESGMHPFVYRKAKMDLKNWPEDSLQNFYTRLVSLYHNSRLGGEDMDVALEKELLKI